MKKNIYLFCTFWFDEAIIIIFIFIIIILKIDKTVYFYHYYYEPLTVEMSIKEKKNYHSALIK